MSFKYAKPVDPKLSPPTAPPNDGSKSDGLAPQPKASRPQHPAGGLRNWSEWIDGCPYAPEKIADWIIFLLDVSKNPWYQTNLSRRFVLQNWRRICDDVPAEYEWDPEPLFREKTIVQDEAKGTRLTLMVPCRRPKNDKERKILQKDPDKWKHLLYNPKCAYGCVNGTIDVSDYPGDPLYERLVHAENCRCVYE